MENKQQKPTLMNSYELLSHKATNLEEVVQLSRLLIEKFERQKNPSPESGEVVKESKPKHCNLIELFDSVESRLRTQIHELNNNLQMISDLID